MREKPLVLCAVVCLAAVQGMACSAIVAGKLSDKDDGKGGEGGGGEGGAGEGGSGGTGGSGGDGGSGGTGGDGGSGGSGGDGGSGGPGGSGGDGGDGGSGGSGGTGGTGGDGGSGGGCEDRYCSGHGTCDDSGDTAVCRCDPGYAGGDCENCDDGFQDNDGNGSCRPDCASAELSCGANAGCDDSSGTVVCVCDPGHQDNDGDDDCSPDCDHAALACGANQFCDDASGTAECLCELGYAAPDCLSCDTDGGYQDNDNDGTCSPDCDTADLGCSEHGPCDDSTGTAVCNCDLTYTGDDCSECVIGYGDDGLGACAWQGVIADPGFDDSSQWEVSGSASIDAGGWALFPQDAMCFGGSVSQTATVPAYEDTYPLALIFNARRGTTGSFAPVPGVFVGGMLFPVHIDTSTTDWVENTICLGELAYGTNVEIALTRFEIPEACAFDAFHIDDVRIEPVGEDRCPTQDQPVLNGDFEQDDVGWPNLSTSSNASVTVGGGSMVLATTDGCVSVSTSGKAWFPSAEQAPNLALQVTYSGTNTGSSTANTLLRIRLNDALIMTLPITGGVEQTHQFCVPDRVRGSVSSVDIQAQSVAPTVCSETYSFTISDISLVTHAECVSGLGLLDGGFEGYTDPAIYSPWEISFNANNGPTDPIHEILNDPSAAHTGSGSLHLEVHYQLSWSMASQSLTVPPADATGGPAVRYWYRAPTPTDPTRPAYYVCIDSAPYQSPSDCQLAFSDDWVEGVLCLDPAATGYPATLNLWAVGKSGTDLTFDSAEVWFDDVELTTDAACPSN